MTYQVQRYAFVSGQNHIRRTYLERSQCCVTNTHETVYKIQYCDRTGVLIKVLSTVYDSVIVLHHYCQY